MAPALLCFFQECGHFFFGKASVDIITCRRFRPLQGFHSVHRIPADHSFINRCFNPLFYKCYRIVYRPCLELISQNVLKFPDVYRFQLLQFDTSKLPAFYVLPARPFQMLIVRPDT